MRRFFRIAVRSLVLLLVALASALTTMRFAIHGREVPVPNLLDSNPTEARRIAEDNGLSLNTQLQYYSDTIAPGRIVSQTPEPGTRVRRGWEIRVALSLGRQKTEIPDLIGQSERAAEINAQRRGLEVGAVDQLPWPTDVSDEIIAQSPPANASGIAAPKIGLLIATQPVPHAYLMPTFVGKQLGSVSSAITNAGFRIGTIVSSSGGPTQAAPSPASVIAAQDPAAGAKVQTGAIVNFRIQ
jgi:beta-lactam-binding protein with PASTA domain